MLSFTQVNKVMQTMKSYQICDKIYSVQIDSQKH